MKETSTGRKSLFEIIQQPSLAGTMQRRMRATFSSIPSIPTKTKNRLRAWGPEKSIAYLAGEYLAMWAVNQDYHGGSPDGNLLMAMWEQISQLWSEFDVPEGSWGSEESDVIVEMARQLDTRESIDTINKYSRRAKGVDIPDHLYNELSGVFYRAAMLTFSIWFGHKLWSLNNSPTYVLEEEFCTYMSLVDICGIEHTTVQLPYQTVEVELPTTLYPVISEIYRIVGGSEEPENYDVSRSCVMVQEDQAKYSGLWFIRSFSECSAALGEGGFCFKFNVQEYIASGEFEEDVIGGLTEKQQLKVAGLLPQLIDFIVGAMLYVTHPDADSILGRNCPEYARWAQAQSSKKRKKKRETKRVRKVREAITREQAHHKYYVGFRVIDQHHAAVEERSKKDQTASGSKKCPHPRRAHQRRCWMLNPKDPKGPKIRVWRPVRSTYIHQGVANELSKIMTGVR